MKKNIRRGARPKGVELTPAVQATTLDQLLDEREVSRVTGRSVASLRRDRLLGVGIDYYKVGALVRYDPRDVRLYLDRNKHIAGGR